MKTLLCRIGVLTLACLLLVPLASCVLTEESVPTDTQSQAHEDSLSSAELPTVVPSGDESIEGDVPDSAIRPVYEIVAQKNSHCHETYEGFDTVTGFQTFTMNEDLFDDVYPRKRTARNPISSRTEPDDDEFAAMLRANGAHESEEKIVSFVREALSEAYGDRYSLEGKTLSVTRNDYSFGCAYRIEFDYTIDGYETLASAGMTLYWDAAEESFSGFSPYCYLNEEEYALFASMDIDNERLENLISLATKPETTGGLGYDNEGRAVLYTYERHTTEITLNVNDNALQARVVVLPFYTMSVYPDEVMDPLSGKTVENTEPLETVGDCTCVYFELLITIATFEGGSNGAVGDPIGPSTLPTERMTEEETDVPTVAAEPVLVVVPPTEVPTERIEPLDPIVYPTAP